VAKKCEKCLTKYDDSAGVCLLCGAKLKDEKECAPVCDIEGDSVEKAEAKKEVRRLLILILVAVLFISVIVFIFSGAWDVWVRVIENMLMRLMG